MTVLGPSLARMKSFRSTHPPMQFSLFLPQNFFLLAYHQRSFLVTTKGIFTKPRSDDSARRPSLPFFMRAASITSAVIPSPSQQKETSERRMLIRQFNTSAVREAPGNTRRLRRFLAEMKKEDIYTIPNGLSALRLLLSPCLGYFIMADHPNLALACFALAGITDLLDGYIARRFHTQTVLGSVLDPLADKVLMTTLTVALTSQSLLPVPLASLILGRDALLFMGAAYYRYRTLPEPKTIYRYFDPALPTVQIKPTFISKVNTALQLVLMGGTLAFSPSGHELLNVLQYVVAGTTIGSALSYIVSRDAIKILKQRKHRRRS